MERVFNESYVHICVSLALKRQTPQTRELVHQFADKAKDFRGRYARALYQMRANEKQFTTDDWAVMHELLVYSTIEMMRVLYLKEKGATKGTTGGGDGAYQLSAQLQRADPRQFLGMLGEFGAEGARSGRNWLACGIRMALGKDGNQSGPQTAAGEANEVSTAADEDKLGSRWFTCPLGHVNYRRVANVKEKRCTTCKISVDCEPPKPPKPQETTPLTWEKALGIKPVEIPGLKSEVGKKALVGAGKT